MKKLLPLIFISTGIVGLSSCGQTGDLYLPKKDTKVASGSTLLTSGSSAKQNNLTSQSNTSSSAQSAQSAQNIQNNTSNIQRQSNFANSGSQNQAPTTTQQKPAQQTVSKNYILTKQEPSAKIASSSSTQNYQQNIQGNSQQSYQPNNKTTKVDNDPTPPAKNFNPSSSQLIDSGDNFAFDQNIQNSSEAGGTPS